MSVLLVSTRWTLHAMSQNLLQLIYLQTALHDWHPVHSH